MRTNCKVCGSIHSRRLAKDRKQIHLCPECCANLLEVCVKARLVSLDQIRMVLPNKPGVCPTCRTKKAEKPHECPYQSDVNGNNDPKYCICCPSCRQQCAEDI